MPDNWLILVHQVPPRPPYLRAKVMRRLTQLGALALKRSAYLLPVSEGTLEDLEWLRREIRDEGGDAWVVEGRFRSGLSDDEVRERFRALRAADYAGLAADARAALDRIRSAAEGDTQADPDIRRLARRLDAVRRIDFFGAEGREEVETLMASIDRLMQKAARSEAPPPGAGLQARTWVTRSGVRVDRLASAWLIRRFIDPAASFVFVEPDTVTSPVADGLRFDMYDGEFTHSGNRCTFEVLLEVAGRTADPGLAAIAQIVHDVDLRDDKYQRPETAGVSALIDGLVARLDDDHRRIAEALSLFDALYASLGGPALTGGRDR